jgi:hypothetical protein
MVAQQTETKTTQEWGGAGHQYRKVQTVDQVIFQGKPAVRVVIDDERATQIGWVLEKRCIDTVYDFGSPTPVSLLGRPVVGQFDDKIRASRASKLQLEPNNDPETWQDYEAWMAAFTDVYANS